MERKLETPGSPEDGPTSSAVLSELPLPANVTDRRAIVEIAVAEFNKLRDEIAGRTNTEWTLLGLNATISATVGGFVLAQRADPLLLLLLPLLAPSLGLLFIDHAFNIGNIGEYINNVLKPLLREAAHDSRLLGYEEWVDKYEEKTVWRMLPFGIPLILLFSAVPIASLLYTVTFVHTSWGWVLWVTGLLMTCVQVAFWAVFLVPPLRRAMLRPEQ